MQDYQLAITICRLYEGELGTSLKIIIRDVLLGHAIEKGLDWLKIICHAMLNEREEVLKLVKSRSIAPEFSSEMLLKFYENSVNEEFILNMSLEWTKKRQLTLAFTYLERQTSEKTIFVILKIIAILTCSVRSSILIESFDN